MTDDSDSPSDELIKRLLKPHCCATSTQELMNQAAARIQELEADLAATEDFVQTIEAHVAQWPAPGYSVIAAALNRLRARSRRE